MTEEQREVLLDRMLEAYLRTDCTSPSKAMRAALSIAEEAVLEEMMEVTPEMMTAFHEHCDEHGQCLVKTGWQAMLSASPLYRRVKGE